MPRVKAGEWFSDHEYRFTILVSGILALLLLAPVISVLPFGQVLFPGLGALIPLAAIYAVSDTRRHLWIGLALGIPAMFGSVIQLSGFAIAELWVTLVFPPAFYGYTVWLVAKKVFTTTRITRDTLAGAACVYLLIGVTWWFFYLIVETVAPGAIGGRGVGLQTPEARFDLLYYSFVTLTTLGYGDMTPQIRATQSLSIVEAIVGVLYLSILIARLVGLYARRQAES